MTDDAWNTDYSKCVGLVLFGDSIDVDDHGDLISGDSLLILFNADHGDPIPFTLPEVEEQRPWERLLDTSRPEAEAQIFQAGHPYPMAAASLTVFRLAAELMETPETPTEAKGGQ